MSRAALLRQVALAEAEVRGGSVPLRTHLRDLLADLAGPRPLPAWAAGADEPGLPTGAATPAREVAQALDPVAWEALAQSVRRFHTSPLGWGLRITYKLAGDLAGKWVFSATYDDANVPTFLAGTAPLRTPGRRVALLGVALLAPDHAYLLALGDSETVY